jgi:hypothetical protein
MPANEAGLRPVLRQRDDVQHSNMPLRGCRLFVLWFK